MFARLQIKVLSKVLSTQALPSSFINSASTARAVFSASPFRVWAYTPSVSMLLLCPTSALTSPAGRFFTMDTNVCRSEYRDTGGRSFALQ